MKFSICRLPVAPVVAAPPMEIGKSRMVLVGMTVPIRPRWFGAEWRRPRLSPTGDLADVQGEIHLRDSGGAHRDRLLNRGFEATLRDGDPVTPGARLARGSPHQMWWTPELPRLCPGFRS